MVCLLICRGSTDIALFENLSFAKTELCLNFYKTSLSLQNLDVQWMARVYATKIPRRIRFLQGWTKMVTDTASTSLYRHYMTGVISI